jgi:endonuclease/exonuclease/phosphatase family metal-dependent hydrolase
MRIGSWNCNNLFSRWDFRTELATVAPRSAGATGMAVLHGEAPAIARSASTMTNPVPTPQVVTVEVGGVDLTGVLRTFQGKLVRGKPERDRLWMGRRIAALNADVLAVQEVEDQEALDAFDRDVLAPLGASYPFRAVVEGNDPRRIDVGICSRIPLGRVSSWRFRPDPAHPAVPVFSRDLLQVEILVPGKPIHLFVNHLKSNYIPDEFRLTATQKLAARDLISARRLAQATAVASVLRQQRLTRRIVVLGDMNDAVDSPCLAPLTGIGLVEQIARATVLPGPNRAGSLVPDKFADLSPTAWTHRFKTTGSTEFSLYDQIWTSPDLTVSESVIMRRTQIGGDASDHDPVGIDLTP